MHMSPVYILVTRFPEQTSRNRGGELGGGVHVLFMLLLVVNETACIHDQLSAIGRAGGGLCCARVGDASEPGGDGLFLCAGNCRLRGVHQYLNMNHPISKTAHRQRY